MPTSTVEPSIADAILNEKYNRMRGDVGQPEASDRVIRKLIWWHLPVPATATTPFFYWVEPGPDVDSDSARFGQWLRKGRRPLPEFFGKEKVGPGMNDDGSPLSMLSRDGQHKFDTFIAADGLTRKDENGNYYMHALQFIEQGFFDMPTAVANRPDVQAMLEFNADGSLKKYECQYCGTYAHPLQANVFQHQRGEHSKQLAVSGPAMAANQQSADALATLAELVRGGTVPASAVPKAPEPSFEEKLFGALTNPEFRAGLKAAMADIEGDSDATDPPARRGVRNPAPA